MFLRFFFPKFMLGVGKRKKIPAVLYVGYWDREEKKKPLHRCQQLNSSAYKSYPMAISS